MKVMFRNVYHIPLEIYMSHKYWFPPCHGADTISATANADGGFTTLTAIRGRYGWSDELIKKASKECNLAGEVAIVTEVKPTLLLVPKTNGNNMRCVAFRCWSEGGEKRAFLNGILFIGGPPVIGGSSCRHCSLSVCVSVWYAPKRRGILKVFEKVRKPLSFDRFGRGRDWPEVVNSLTRRHFLQNGHFCHFWSEK